MHSIIRLLLFLIAFMISIPGYARFIENDLPFISYVKFESADPLIQTPIPFEKHVVSGQFRVPTECADEDIICSAVVIVHGTAGVDSRGKFYAEAFNRSNIATLEIDMWAPRGWLGGITGRPDSPAEIVATLADVYGALTFLSNHPNIDPERIAIIGFSFGGVLSMLSATNPYNNLLTGGVRKFAAHIAHYPICWVYNVVPGAEFQDFTGSPVLIQVGELDGYHGPETCPNLVKSLPDDAQQFISAKVYRKAGHAWDRLQPKITVFDPFACFGEGCEVDLAPRLSTAFKSKRNAVRFLRSLFQLNGNGWN